MTSFKLHRFPSAIIFLVFAMLTYSCQEEQLQTDCENNYLPVVFVHGHLSSGGIFANQVMRFSSNNYCDNQLYAFDWNTQSGAAGAISNLNGLISRILETTGAPKVNLVGHGAGGGLCYAYLSDASRAAKVARYVHAGSEPQSLSAGPNGGIPTLNLYSAADPVVAGADIPGATNKSFTGLDHYQPVAAPAPFAEIYAFFNSGQQPLTTEIEESDDIQLSGRVLSFGENRRYAQASINIYEVNPNDGRRRNSQPDTTLITDDKGNWGPWRANAGVLYEFHLIDGAISPDVIPVQYSVHYYCERFKRSNPLVYLRVFPGVGTLAGSWLERIFQNRDQAVLAMFSNSQAVNYQRDMLSVNGDELSTAQLTPAAKSIGAIFLYDDGDQQTGSTIHPGFQMLETFITGVDYFIPAVAPASTRLELNGRILFVPNWKFQWEGSSVAVFD
jgi:pimeloyl-ACP methyl ester carboxylesterase